MNKRSIEPLFVIGSSAMVIASLLAIIIDPDYSAFKYFFLAGAILYTLYFLLFPVKDATTRVRRLFRLNLLGGIFFITAGVFSFSNHSLSIAFFTAGVIFAVYATVLRIKIGIKNDKK